MASAASAARRLGRSSSMLSTTATHRPSSSVGSRSRRRDRAAGFARFVLTRTAPAPRAWSSHFVRQQARGSRPGYPCNNQVQGTEMMVRLTDVCGPIWCGSQTRSQSAALARQDGAEAFGSSAVCALSFSQEAFRAELEWLLRDSEVARRLVVDEISKLEVRGEGHAQALRGHSRWMTASCCRSAC